MSGFKKFLMRGNLIDLAVAFVMGAAFSGIVTALVKGLIDPLIAATAGSENFGKLHFTLNKTDFPYGLVVTALISFLLIGLVVYFLIVAPVNRLMAMTARKKEATERDCPECLSQIPVAATRCKFCTATITPEVAGATADAVAPASNMPPAAGRHASGH